MGNHQCIPITNVWDLHTRIQPITSFGTGFYFFWTTYWVQCFNWLLSRPLDNVIMCAWNVKRGIDLAVSSVPKFFQTVAYIAAHTFACFFPCHWALSHTTHSFNFLGRGISHPTSGNHGFFRSWFWILCKNLSVSFMSEIQSLEARILIQCTHIHTLQTVAHMVAQEFVDQLLNRDVARVSSIACRWRLECMWASLVSKCSAWKYTCFSYIDATTPKPKPWLAFAALNVIIPSVIAREAWRQLNAVALLTTQPNFSSSNKHNKS